MKNIKTDLSRKGQIRNDLILIAAVFIIIAAGSLFLFFGGDAGSYAVVTYNGTEIARYPLDEDRTETVFTGEDDCWSNTLVIQNGKVSVSDANCPDGICVSHRSISKTGETIICLPHNFVISIAGADGGGLDGVA